MCPAWTRNGLNRNNNKNSLNSFRPLQSKNKSNINRSRNLSLRRNRDRVLTVVPTVEASEVAVVVVVVAEDAVVNAAVNPHLLTAARNSSSPHSY